MTRLMAGAMAGALALTMMMPAEAQAVDTYMYGVGGYIGTSVFPGRYPLDFPGKINKYDFDKDGERDTDKDGNELQTTLERVGFDFQTGVEGLFWVDKGSRIGGDFGFIFGKRFFDFRLIGFYDVMFKQASVDFFGGVGAGVGQMTFRGENDVEKLRVPYLPVRGRLGFEVRDGSYNYQGSLYAQVAFPTGHRYVKVNGVETDELSAPLNYIQAGLQVAMHFGDFKPPKKKKRRRGNKKKKKRGGRR